MAAPMALVIVEIMVSPMTDIIASKADLMIDIIVIMATQTILIV
jgi:hypothetical protein